jgi:hypothetical protein
MCDDRLYFRLPSAMRDLLTQVAASKIVSKSTYVRQAVLRQMEQDGFRLQLPLPK